MSPQQIVFFVILLVAIGLLVTERLRPQMVAVLIILSLAATSILKPEEALAGFSSEPAIVIACVFVLSAGFELTGLSDILSSWVSRAAGGNLTRTLLICMPAAALMSAPTHHVTVTAIFLSVMLALSREHHIPPSKLLLPVTVASSVGTTITILGAPSFLVSSELLKQAGRPGLGVLSIAPIGLVLTAVATIYMVVVGRFLLPDRRGRTDSTEHFRLDDYYTEVAIPDDSPHVGKSPADLEEGGLLKLNVLGRVRNGQRVPTAVMTREPLTAGEVLLVRTTPDELATIRQEPGIELQPVAKYGIPEATKEDGKAAEAPPDDEADVEEQMVQTVVAPNSSLVGRTLGDIDFRRRYGLLVLGIWRQNAIPADQMSHIRLRQGDVLVLQGPGDALAELGRDRDFLMLTPFQGRAVRRTKALLCAAIMVATICLAAFNLLSISLAAMAGAAAMVLTRCVSSRQALRSIDAPMYLFIAGAIPLGTAIKKTGTAQLVAGWLQGLVGGWSEAVVLGVIFLVVGLIVQFMGSDSATVALFGPVAVALGQALGHPPEPYIIAVAMAAVTALLTPMSHHNLLIYRPGGYRFTDYTIIGAPLTLVFAVVVALMAPLLWPS